VFQSWYEKRYLKIKYIQPDKPTQNAYIKRFKNFFRKAILDAYWFEDIKTLKDLAEN